VYDALAQYSRGKWEPGVRYLGIREGALDYAVDTHNRSLVTREVIEQVEDAKDRILRGQITVPVYSKY
jgi:basic membrane protein A